MNSILGIIGHLFMYLSPDDLILCTLKEGSNLLLGRAVVRAESNEAINL